MTWHKIEKIETHLISEGNLIYIFFFYNILDRTILNIFLNICFVGWKGCSVLFHILFFLIFCEVIILNKCIFLSVLKESDKTTHFTDNNIEYNNKKKV